ncbi:MAG: Ig-like domain-containing protein [Spirochaetales bacterium]|nr:Ig-like domain-containing protein [Spirochaetales bacterium]
MVKKKILFFMSLAPLAFILGCVNPSSPAPLATGVTLNHSEFTLYSGGTSEVQLMPSFLPLGASTSKLIWKSSKPSVATVDENGLVKRVISVERPTAYSIPETVITATSEDGIFSAQCMVQVNCANPITDVIYDIYNAKISLAGGGILTGQANVPVNLQLSHTYAYPNYNYPDFTIKTSAPEPIHVLYDGRIGSFTLTQKGMYTVTIIPKDGSPTFTFQANISEDQTPPNLFELYFEASDRMRIGFDEPMDSQWLSVPENVEGFTITKSQQVDSNVFVFEFKESFLPGETRQIRFKNAEDVSGNVKAEEGGGFTYIPVHEIHREKVQIQNGQISGEPGAVTFEKTLSYDHDNNPETPNKELIEKGKYLWIFPSSIEFSSVYVPNGYASVKEDGSFEVLKDIYDETLVLTPGKYHLYFSQEIRYEYTRTKNLTAPFVITIPN